MKLDDFKNKKIAILGSGVEGASSASFMSELGAQVVILDQNQGKEYLSNLGDYDIVIKSPGVKRNLPEIIEAEKKGALITSQTKIFFDLCPCKIVGITGTKGKGTTSSLIYEMLKQQGKDVYLGGNIGMPPLDFLNKLNTQSIVLLELSSFQLMDLNKSPRIAVMLMTTSEHLDYHKDILEYVEAKRSILKYQKPEDFAILNKDYPAARESDVLTEAKIYWVSREDKVNQGCFVKGKKIILKLGKEEREIIDVSEILLPGKHNLENVCAAVMAAALCEVSVENITKVLKTFKGLEHRLELVGEINGVKYYDDSFSTIPETAIAAIESFNPPAGGLILILGGSSKNSDFSELGKVISNSKNVKVIIGMGDEWPRIKSEIKNLGIKIYENCRNMEEIVQKASEVAEPGDVVLLSPACASFGMFKNYKDRGDQFKKEVSKTRTQ